MMPGWFRSRQVLQRFFKEICRLVYRSGFQSVINHEAIRLFEEGVELFRLLQDSLLSSQRTREENEEQLSMLEARCNCYRESIVMALTVYDIALNLEQTMDLSDEEPVANNEGGDGGWSYEADWSIDTNTSSAGVDDLTDPDDDFPEEEDSEDELGDEEQASSVIAIDSDSDVEVFINH